LVDFLSGRGLTSSGMSQIDAQVRSGKQAGRGPLGIVPTERVREPTGRRGNGDLDRRTEKIAELVNDRRAELGLTHESLAHSAGLKVSALRSKLFYRTGAPPDIRMLGSLSVALGWEARYLPGLWTGEFDFDADPLELDAPPPAKRAKPWSTTPGTRDAALEKTVRVQGAKIRILEDRLAEVTARLDELAGVSRKHAV
jgi:hypothetical protein